MKPVILSLLTGGLLAAASPVIGPKIPYYMGHPVNPAYLQKRQLEGIIGGIAGAAMNMGGGGKVADPAGAAPRLQNLSPRISGYKTVKVRYGPYKIPNMNTPNMMAGHGGSIYNLPDVNVQKPCTDCTIIGVNSAIEYPDGREAHVNEGLWLHHYVHFVAGPGRVDATCGNSPMSLPHMIIGSSAKGAERFFSSGNERTKMSIPILTGSNSTFPKVGYHLRPNDKMHLIVDLMNENAQDKVVYLTTTYDFVDGNPAGYDDLRPVWFDVMQCGTSEVNPPKQSGSFTITAGAWRPTFEGEVLGYAGHLHNGGTKVDMFVNGQNACSSLARYGENDNYLSSGHGHGGSTAMAGMGEGPPSYISTMTTCKNTDLRLGKSLKKADSWQLKADYDYNKYPGMKSPQGRQDSIMGISIMFVKVPRGQGAPG